jgi:glycosyltransferase involved in cell wall biosynthesis
MPILSATIVTLNEQETIARAIRSLSAADEVIVVDSGSTDDTCRIATTEGARVLHNPWPGYAAQKNFAASQATHDWILSLDADEEMNPRAQAALQQWKESFSETESTGGEILPVGYRWPRRAFYMGRWIGHSGWYPDWKIRLYHRRHGAWRGDYVHESVTVDGPVSTLPGEILHYTWQSIAEQYKRTETYTGLAAREMAMRGRRASAADLLLAPPFTFLQTYFLKLGFLDGYAGFCIARAAAHYVHRKYQKLKALPPQK